MKEINEIAKMPTFITRDNADYSLRMYITAWDKLAVGYGDSYNQVHICAFIVDGTNSKELYTKQGRMNKKDIECYIEGVNTLEEAFNKCYEFICNPDNKITFKE